LKALVLIEDRSGTLILTALGARRVAQLPDRPIAAGAAESDEPIAELAKLLSASRSLNLHRYTTCATP
jgi:hypothetical protein